MSAELRTVIEACVAGLDPSLATDWLLRAVLDSATARARCANEGTAAAANAIAAALQLSVVRARTAPAPRARAALFFPSNVSFRHVLRLLDGAERSLDVCVYTVTDRQIRERILAAHARRVRVRIVTDDKKAFDQGSAIFPLAQAGVPIVVAEQEEGWAPSNSPGARDGGGARERHMHHKFALVDGRVLLTGSFNWTHAAHQRNQENLLVTDEPYFVARYGAEFEKAWDACRRDNRLGTNAAALRIQALYRGQSFRRSFSKESFGRLVLGDAGAQGAAAALPAVSTDARAVEELRAVGERMGRSALPAQLEGLYRRQAQRPSPGANPEVDAAHRLPPAGPERTVGAPSEAAHPPRGAPAPGGRRTPPRSPPQQPTPPRGRDQGRGAGAAATALT